MQVQEVISVLGETGLTGAPGSEAWWQQVAMRGTPLHLSGTEKECDLLFLWRDPQGDETSSATVRVYMDINSVTDHHSPSPTSMQRLPGTDVWFWQVRVPSHWRGSYQLIPAQQEQQAPTPYDPEQHRAWWIRLMEGAIADPLNPKLAQRSMWGGQLSALHMPDAPLQPGWEAVDRGEVSQPQDVIKLEWHSEQLHNRRDIWVYQSGPSHESLPLVLLLDGRFWATGMPVFATLAEQTSQGRLPAALYVLIDEIDSETRGQELPCNPTYWQAIQAELLPLLAARWQFSDDPARTLVAGQSYGGLAALYAASHWPERFGCVLSQSGSFWWPDRSLFTSDPIHGRRPGCGGWLTSELRQRTITPPLKVWLEAGTREGEMIDLSETMSQVLASGDHDVLFRSFEGGHDRLCWRGGLIDGLRWLLS